MLKEQIREICAQCGLTQKALADVMGVEHQRVRNMAAGRVDKMLRREGEALIRKLHIRAEWLATGQPPMFQNDQEVRAEEILNKVGDASECVAALGLDRETGRLVHEFIFYAMSGMGDSARRALAELSHVTTEERELLTLFRAASLTGKAAAIGALQGATAAKIKKQINITASGSGSQAAGRNIINKSRRS